MESRLLKPRDAAVLLGLSESTLAKMRLTGAGPIFRKLSRTVRYRVSDIEEWVEARARKSTSETIKPR